MSQKVVIIGHSYSSRLGLIRSSAVAGCDVSVVVMVSEGQKRHRPIDCYSKYVKHCFFCCRRKDDELIQLLLEKCRDDNQKVILIPDSDETAAAIDSNRDVLHDYFVFPHIVDGKGTVRSWMDKSKQKQLASEVGLNVASASIVEIKEGQYTIPVTINYPCFTKPLATLNGGKGGMRRCNDEEELKAALEYIAKHRSRNEKVLVEDYLDIEKEYALVGFSDGDRVIIPGLFQLLRISKSSPGIAIQGRVFPTDGFESVLSLFKEFVRRTGFVGLFDIDFFLCRGAYYFGEMNLRFGGSGYAMTKMGVNLPEMMVRFLSGEERDTNQQTITGSEIYVNERLCFDDWNRGLISWDEYSRIMKESQIHFVQDKIDKCPWKAYLWMVSGRRVIKKLKGLLGK